MVKIYKQPFAHGGDTIAIPDVSQPDGKMSSADGWTVDYQLPSSDPDYKPVDRQEMNGVFKEVTEALGQVQVQGAASWSADGAPYPISAQVYHNGKQWIALRANSVAPAEGADWKVADLSSSIRLSEPIDQLPDAETVQEALVGIGESLGSATETVRGTLRIATQEEVDDGVLDDVTVTPKKLRHGLLFSFGTNGYFFLPTWLTGFGLQWGAIAAVSGGNSINFPLAFPTAFLSRPMMSASNDTGGVETVQYQAVTKTGFSLVTNGAFGAGYIIFGH